MRQKREVIRTEAALMRVSSRLGFFLLHAPCGALDLCRWPPGRVPGCCVGSPCSAVDRIFVSAMAIYPDPWSGYAVLLFRLVRFAQARAAALRAKRGVGLPSCVVDLHPRPYVSTPWLHVHSVLWHCGQRAESRGC